MNRQKAYVLLEGGFQAGRGAKLVASFLVTLIFLNAIAVIAESVGNNYERYRLWFIAFEVFSVAVFTVEYFLRLWVAAEADDAGSDSVARVRLRYAFSAPAIIDLLAILPSYLAMFVGVDLRTLRMLRLLRLLKLHKYFGGLNLFFEVLRRETVTLLSAIGTLMILILLAATLIYSVESSVQPEAFGSVLDAFWWAAVTMTTVGYGDIVPVTPLGQVLASLMMVLGVGIVAMPAGMLAARFSEELQTRREELEAEIDVALRDGHISEVEHSKLDLVRKELAISQEYLDRVLQLMSAQQQMARTCPHCGKKIDPTSRV